VDESCGKCVPCRTGGRKLLYYLTKICHGKGEMADIEKMKQVSEAMCRASLCGLGQTSSNPVSSSLRYFMDEYKEHILEKKCRAGKCQYLLTYSIDRTKCVGCDACARLCPAKAISGERKQPHVIDPAKCLKCGQCYAICKFHAVTRA
jgi:ferredoxin